jgi:hypothetical protein
MDNIYEPDPTFSFDKLVLTKPISVSGGNYFIKFKMNNYPLYIQSPKCRTKQGIVKAGKRFFTDLMFNNENEEFIQWMENLENYSQKYIYEHRAEWFETELEMHDIENSFAPLLKLYKSGKYYLARANVPGVLGKCTLKIYDEQENEVDSETITNNENVITILEIQGIKCSARSFQIEIEIKQMLVLKPEKIFEKCILTKGVKSITQHVETFSNNDLDEIKNMNEENFSPPDEIAYESTCETFDIADASTYNTISNESHEEPVESPIEEPTQESPVEELKVFSNNIPESFEPVEIEFNLDELNVDDTIQLKNRNDVYYKMYREAKKKAKMAKDLALSSYLEAKRIKNIYMLDEIDDSDSDLEEDEEFEESMHDESAI